MGKQEFVYTSLKNLESVGKYDLGRVFQSSDTLGIKDLKK